jgi:redox-sensitive bicupin YhaK (pirin superfamily)
MSDHDSMKDVAVPGRREALQKLALSGAGAVAACAPKTTVEPAASAPSEPEKPSIDPVLRVVPLGSPPWPTFDPFLFCVYHHDAYPAGNGEFAPAASLAGRDLGQDFAGIGGWRMYHGMRVPGFPSHPHRGFETVTVTRKGLVDHSDSLGAAARYGEGDVQWLTAGRGIQHAEMFPLLREDGDNPLELFQIWLNLPARDKFAAPHFAMLWGPTVPKRDFRDGEGRTTHVAIVAGRLHDAQPPAPPPESWASKPASDVAIWTLRLEPGARWTVPPAKPGTNRTLYFFRGDRLHVGPREVTAGHAARVQPEAAIALRNGNQEAEVLVLQGRPIDEPVVQYGPFAMNTAAEIRQAYTDYQRTQFGGWPWPARDPVHGSQGRFARHADGRIERA